MKKGHMVMNITKVLARLRKGGPTASDGDRYLYRIKPAEANNDLIESRILGLATGKSVGEILSIITTGLTGIWVSYEYGRVNDAIKRLEYNGFIRVEK